MSADDAKFREQAGNDAGAFAYDDFNALVAAIKLSADAATDGLRSLAKAAPMPQQGPGASLVFRGAHHAIQEAIQFLESPKASAIDRAADIAALKHKVDLLLASSATAESRDARGRSLTNYPAWRMCRALGYQALPVAALVVGGLLLLEAIHNERRVPNKLAQDLIRDSWRCTLTTEELRALLDSDVDAADTEWPWLADVQRRWPSMLNLLCDNVKPPPPPGFNKRARNQLWAKSHYAAPTHKAGTPTHRHLSKSQFDASCKQIAAWLETDDWRGAFAILGAETGFTIDLVPEVPFNDTVDESWAACLELEPGVLLTDLSFLAPEAAQAPGNESAIPASYVNRKPIPELLARNPRRRKLRFPDARKFGELYPEAPPVAGHEAMLATTHEITI